MGECISVYLELPYVDLPGNSLGLVHGEGMAVCSAHLDLAERSPFELVAGFGMYGSDIALFAVYHCGCCLFVLVVCYLGKTGFGCYGYYDVCWHGLSVRGMCASLPRLVREFWF